MTIFGVAPKSGSAARRSARRDGIWALTLQNVDVPILVIEPHLTAAARNFAADRVRPDLPADAHFVLGVNPSEGGFSTEGVAHVARNSHLDRSEGCSQQNRFAR